MRPPVWRRRARVETLSLKRFSQRRLAEESSPPRPRAFWSRVSWGRFQRFPVCRIPQAIWAFPGQAALGLWPVRRPELRQM